MCLDEFEVTDVADAFIVSRLFTALFEEGVCLVTTSNRAPSDLYHDGLNREVFLPTIDALEKHCEVISLVDSPSDFRLLKVRANMTSRYVMGDEEGGNGGGREAAFESLWEQRVASEKAAMEGGKEGGAKKPARLESKSVLDGNRIVLSSRSAYIPTLSPCKTLCKFTFEEMFENSTSQPMGSAEFAMVAEHFSAIFVSDVPNLNNGGCSIDCLRRLVLFVDSCYDAKCELFISSKHDISDLWDGEKDIIDPKKMNEHGDLLGGSAVVPVDTFTKYSLDRTISRLYEMCSDSYIQASRNRSEDKVK